MYFVLISLLQIEVLFIFFFIYLPFLLNLRYSSNAHMIGDYVIQRGQCLVVLLNGTKHDIFIYIYIAFYQETLLYNNAIQQMEQLEQEKVRRDHALPYICIFVLAFLFLFLFFFSFSMRLIPWKLVLIASYKSF